MSKYRIDIDTLNQKMNEKGMTVKMLHILTDIPIGSLSRIKSGVSSKYEYAVKIAKALDIPFTEIKKVK